MDPRHHLHRELGTQAGVNQGKLDRKPRKRSEATFRYARALMSLMSQSGDKKNQPSPSAVEAEQDSRHSSEVDLDLLRRSRIEKAEQKGSPFLVILVR